MLYCNAPADSMNFQHHISPLVLGLKVAVALADHGVRFQSCSPSLWQKED